MQCSAMLIFAHIYAYKQPKTHHDEVAACPGRSYYISATLPYTLRYRRLF